MKALFLFIMLSVAALVAPDISDVRAAYRDAAENQEKTEKLYDELKAITETDAPVLLGYKGATATLMAKFAKGVKLKTSYFKEGEKLIELAIGANPENIELRYIRLSVQENAPKIVRYKKDISKDKQLILDNYKSIKNAEIMKYIKGFVSQSVSFTEAEKELF